MELLRYVFARYGLAEHLHSDNGSQFTSEVFRNFTKANNIWHTFSAPYHPATNGEMECFVQTFKQAMGSARSDSAAVKRHRTKFLFVYRNVPHATIGNSPAMLLMGRGLQTRCHKTQHEKDCGESPGHVNRGEERATQRIRSWRQSSGKKLSQRSKVGTWYH